ncbi:MAG: reverse transcriptase domain-containing protein, partial [Nanoarchaeota archaeon]
MIHHALINIICNLFQKSFIYDSHANQIGKGTLKAIERFDLFKRKVSRNNTRECYVLKADIKHYFEEVNHEILINIIKGKIRDEKVIWLIKQILFNTASKIGGGGEQQKGMPLGSHTSQFFANIYLNELDQFV